MGAVNKDNLQGREVALVTKGVMQPDTEHAESAEREFSPAETKRLLRKIDWALLPLLSLLYLLSFLDRANIGNARLAGLEEDLNMPGKWDYSVAVSVFFPFYVASEIPSNLAMKHFRPSFWIPSIMLAWGIVMTLMGIVHNYPGLLATRMALGLAEGGLFPGVTYYITLWYKRHECGLRIAIFFSAATAAGAFGGLLARGIMEMSGVGGLAGWAWIFILEGILTVLVALFAFYALHDYPDTAQFLNPDERQEVVRRLREDNSVLSNEFRSKFVKDALKDWKIWVHMFITIGIFLPVYSVSIFLPTIIRSMGHAGELAQLMSAPPYVTACFATVIGGFAADKQRQRGVYVISFCLVAIIGLVILITVENNSVKYFACFLVLSGIFAYVPQGTSWNGNNIGGSVKRGVGLAMQIGFGNLGGAIAGFIYRQEDAPHYRSGHGTLIATLCMSCSLAIFMRWYLHKENAKRDRMYKALSEYTLAELEQEADRGDDATFFRYTI
ncbi:major facilitator superfamily domain-containing protein [Dactylonectria estremocensis]|uniref:Major facilitator superfamily domain-containing protein n=1 Tax=Dactylonectria estremocensis TaxID=1079267 RepID=A0A9P9CYB9_9HYPO|nr:major facilitator superfamily domain-containing protein [Dactylonectria estremocensis]